MCPEGRGRRLGRAALEAAVIAVAAALVAFAVNLARPVGLPLVAARPYETLVPCPEPGGEVTAVEPGEALAGRARAVVIDAREVREFAAGHLPGAINVPFDWLDPTPETRLRELTRAIAASGAQRVLVYGDGGRPDSGEHLAREISGRGIKNAGFVRGGAPALFPGGVR